MKRLLLLVSIIISITILNAVDFMKIQSKAELDTPDTKKNTLNENVKKAPPVSKVAYKLLNEGFESGTIPADWTVVNGNGDGYQFSAVTYASGSYDPSTPNGGTYYAQYNDDAAGSSVATIEELITPAINTTFAEGGLTLSYDFNMQDYAGYGYFESQIRTFSGAVWSGWTAIINHTVDQISSDSLDISAFLPADSVQIRIYFNDENYWGWGMGIDNIILSAIVKDSNDLSITSIIEPSSVIINPTAFYPEIEVSNMGYNDQSSFDIACLIYDKDSGLLVHSDTTSISDTLYSDSTKLYTFDKSFTPKYLHNYSMITIVNLSLDSLNLNDTLNFEFRTHDLNVSLSNLSVPASMNYTSDYTFTADVFNSGGQTADFDVYLVIISLQC